MSATDSVCVTTIVPVSPQTAFEIFTDDVDCWWKRGPRFRPGGGVMRFDGGEGGRLVEEGPDGEEFEIGQISVWKPGDRLELTWRNRNFTAEQITQVEVRFAAAATGTRVTIEHRGWDSLPEGHPARHGLEGAAFSSMIGVWWADQAVSVRLYAKESDAH